MRKVPVHLGYKALVDDEDFNLVINIAWHRMANGGYAAGRVSEHSPMLLMHRVIMNPPPGMQIDHIDHNPLNNQRSNLRIVTQSQNRMNMKKRRHDYKGIHPHGDRWKAIIKYRAKTIHIGVYDTPEEAARAYDRKANEIFREFAQLNFIK